MKAYAFFLMIFFLTVLPFYMFGQEEEIRAPEDKDLTEEDRGWDDRINDWVSPATEAISSLIFWEIPLKSSMDAPVSGRIVRIYDTTGYQIVVIEQENGLLEKMELPLGENILKERGTQVQQGDEIVKGLGFPFVVIWLILGATIFTLYYRFVNIRRFKLSINIVRGKYTDPKEAGEVSHFQALTAALSATVGLGNIAGVAIAISIGGPGAIIWMIFAGLLGMSSKFAECTLGVRYRQIDENGVVHGGPMYYLSQGLKEKGFKVFGKILAVIFAIFCIGASFGGGNMFQANQAFKQFTNAIPAFIPTPPGFVFGIVLAILVALVIIGGIKSIARVTEKIVPFMVVVYVSAALFIIGVNYQQIPESFSLIFNGAFGAPAVAGGLVGVLIQGFRRAAFSNEAGIGSASIAHAAVKTNNPVSEGLVALLEPFIDTVVICTMTALVIVITNSYDASGDVEGVSLTSNAFASVITGFDYILVVAVLLFAFSTMISWSYYGVQSWTYLFGTTKKSEVTYKVIFCIFVVIGSAMQLDQVFDFSDAMILAMAFPNILGIYFLMPVVKEELDSYIRKIRSGQIIRRN